MLNQKFLKNKFLNLILISIIFIKKKRMNEYKRAKYFGKEIDVDEFFDERMDLLPNISKNDLRQAHKLIWDQRIFHIYLLGSFFFCLSIYMLAYDPNIRRKLKEKIINSVEYIKYIYIKNPKLFTFIVFFIQIAQIFTCLPFYFLFNLFIATVIIEDIGICWNLVFFSSLFSSIISYVSFKSGCGSLLTKSIFKEKFVEYLSNQIYEREYFIQLVIRFLFVPQSIIEIVLGYLTVEFKKYIIITIICHAVNSAIIVFLARYLFNIPEYFSDMFERHNFEEKKIFLGIILLICIKLFFSPLAIIFKIGTQ